MKQRIKWLLAGVGVMFAMQVIILLAIHSTIPQTAPPGFSNLLATVVSTLIAFMAGGFVIGLMAEQLEILEPALATLLTLGIDVLSTLTGGLTGLFLFSFAVNQGDYGTALTIGLVAVVASLAGALGGERLTVPGDSWVTQTLMLVGLAGLILGPFVLLASFLPWSVTIGLGAILLCGVVYVSRRFRHQDEEEQEMSIRPESSRKAHG